jgi:glycogen debranching enzyme
VGQHAPRLARGNGLRRARGGGFREAASPVSAREPVSLGIQAEVRRLMYRNLHDGYSSLLGQHYCYVTPSCSGYPFQFFWDTCFHVIILARLGELDLAKRNLRSLFAMQQENGFVGHMIFWKQVLPKRRTDIVQARPCLENIRPHMSALIQPPFAAQALLQLFEACGDRVYLGELYARVRRWHEWLAMNRDFDGDGLITLITAFESGMDWKASYDPVLGYAQRKTPTDLYFNRLFWKGVGVDLHNFARRYELAAIRRRARFLVKDAGFNSAYALDLDAMEKLAELVGDDAQIFARRRERVVGSILRLMYDEEAAAFYDLQSPGDRKLRINTPTIFFPLALPGINDAIARRVLEAHFDNEDQFAAPLPIPSLERRDPAFCPRESPFIWRGPMWACINWFLYRALKRRGFEDKALALRRALETAIANGGFREYYDPFTGEGYGAEDFTWSGLLLDMV